MGLHQTKNFLHSKRNYHQIVKATYWIREDISNHIFDKGLISKIYKELLHPLKVLTQVIQLNLHDLNSKKSKQPHWKMGRGPQQTFFQRRHTDGQQTHERCSASLIIRDMHIKTRMRYHLPPVRMAILQKTINDKCWRECGEKGTLIHCWWESKLVQLLWKTVWRFLKI